MDTKRDLFVSSFHARFSFLKFDEISSRVQNSIFILNILRFRIWVIKTSIFWLMILNYENTNCCMELSMMVILYSE